ncbi:MAG: N-6 DNA methylase, partial [Synechococcus sp. SB0664_bin_36]|nr:N-6 DNA methylase [Synechococcus sp. SB0664_bin_36]
MTASSAKLTKAVTAYCAELHRIRASGGGTGERSSCGPLATLLNGVGATLKPRVFCVGEMANQGAGHPDFGLYGARQVQKGRPREGQLPERGVVEVKGANHDAWLTATSDQVSRYWERYRLVLVTNLRQFVLVGEDNTGRPARLETFQLAQTAEAFRQALDKPQALARTAGAGLGEYLSRALSHRAALAEPKDLAWLLASYARDGLARVEAAGDAPQLATVRSALEEALGVRFEGEKGARFFRSTLVQTLFYGVFSAWVLWARQDGSQSGGFDWRTAVWHLRSPVLAALFSQLAQPGRLQPLGLVEVLDWSAAALERVDRTAFFSRFTTGEAVPYFYEPFLEAFDPTLRKELGVWYTPTEVVQAMVARVDNTLKQDLGIPDGLAAENVVVLDPCCGTGAYLAAVLRRIAANLEGQGLGALAGARVKAAATGRVFGFEIMPAPLVVAQLQVGLTLEELDAPLTETGNERAGVFLTNALTGWESHVRKPLPSFPELEEERDRAERVKQKQPILVILGNPPYNGFAGLAVDEERALSNAYRTTRRVRRPEGQGLNDLYVRFFRMAERRIAEKTGQGVICFISNYSWLDGLSFTGMRERFLEVFDAVRIDCLNGDVRKGGKTPDGEPDGSVFTVGGQSVGIQVGTAIATLVRKRNHKPVGAPLTCLRHLWGPAQAKREELLATAEMEPGKTYQEIKPILPLGLPFVQTAVSDNWFDWPSLPELFPKSFPGVKTSRDGFLVEVDLDRLRARVADYFNPALSHEDIARRYPGVMKKTARFDAHAVRDMLLKRGGPNEAGFVRFAYRPFDNRWLYWEAETKLLDEKRADYWPHVFKGNLWISSSKREIQSDFTHGLSVSHLAGWKLGFWGIHLFPARLREEGITNPNGQARRPNLSIAAQKYLTALGVSVEDLFYHVLAVLHDPAYREANAGALRMGWPRIPLPGWPKGDAEGAAVELARSAAHGRQLAALLDPDVPVPGVTQAPLRPEMKVVAVPSTTDRGNMANEDFAVTAGWGHFGKGDAVMPGQGRVVERPFTPEERSAMAPWHGTLAPLGPLGDTTLDVYLNDHAFWRNVPLPVWRYKLGGYQVLKKWLSYR